MISSFPLTIQVNAINCTVDQGTRLVGGTLSGSVTFNSTNSIYANITSSSSGVTSAGNCNGFYNDAQTFGAVQNVVSFWPFQNAAAGYYYLNDASGFRNVGTSTSVPTWLVSDLAKRTTYPPLVVAQTTITNSQILSPQAQRDTDALDLGYHYSPLDWAVGWVLVTNGTITMTAGTVVGAFGTNSGTYGLAIGQNAALQSTGTPNNPNWIVLPRNSP
jgi:hypothetical protein